MRACVLTLCIFTLLQLQSGYVESTEDLWLPNIRKLASIISNCERDLDLEDLPSLQLLEDNSKSNNKVELNTRAKSKGDSTIKTSSNVEITNGDNEVSVSSNVDLGPKKGRKQANSKGPNKARGDQSSVDNSISVNLGDKLPSAKADNKKQKKTPLKPRTAKKVPQLSLSIGDNNNNNQIIGEPASQPAISNILTIDTANQKQEPRSPWGFKLQGLSVGSGKPRAPPAKGANSKFLRKRQLYTEVAKCVKQRLVKEYQAKAVSSF